MSHSLARRKSSVKGISTLRESSGSVLKFRWSTSVTNLTLLDDNLSVTFPSIDTHRSQENIFVTPRSLIDKNSVSQSPIHTSKSSFLSNVAKQCQSPVSTEQEKSSIPNTPLLLTYAQLHQLPPPSRVRRPTYTHACIDPILNDKRNSISVVNGKVFFTSRPSDSSTTTISLLSTKDNYEIVNDNFVRLKTPQLRRLSVSEKYINEAKKLYFNPDCRIFVPRVAIGQVF